MEYEIRYKDNSPSKKFVPKCLENTSKDCFVFDYFAYRCGDQKTFFDTLKALTGSDKEIKRVGINYQRNGKTAKHNSYSVIFDNPYINGLFEGEKGKFKHVRQTKNGETRLLYNSIPYQEMIDYVFEQLENNPGIFLEDICKHNAELKKTFKKYSLLHFENMSISYSGKDTYEYFDKKREIESALMDYRNFRWMAIDRYNYELKEKKERDRELKREQKDKEKLLKQEEKELKKALKEIAKEDKGKSKTILKDRKEYLDEYNQELDEYLSMEEYNGMTSDETVVEIPRKTL